MNLSFVFKLIVSAAFCVVLAQVARSEAFANMLRDADLRYVAASFALSFIMLALSCAKWRVLLQHQGHTVGFARLYRIYLVGYFYTNLLPSNVGGDVARSYLAGRDIHSQADAAISVFMERFTGMIGLLLLLIVAPCLKPELYREPEVWLPALGAVGLLLLLVWIGRVSDPLGSLVSHWGEKTPTLLQKMRDKAVLVHGKLTDAVTRLNRDKSMLAVVVVLTALFYVLTWVNVWVSFKAFGVHLAFFDVAALLPTAMIVAMVPIVPLAGLGLAEGVYVYYFKMLDVPSAGSLAMGLLLRLKLIVLGVLGWMAQMAPGLERMSKQADADIE